MKRAKRIVSVCAGATLLLLALACTSARSTPAPVVIATAAPTVDTEAIALRAAGGSRVDTFERDDETWYRGSILVHASAAATRKAVLDYGHYSSFIHPFEKSVIVARHGASADVYLKVPLYQGQVVLWAIERFAAPVHEGRDEKIAATMVRGNVADARAVWKFRPVDADHTMVVIEVLVRPAFAVPASLVDDNLRGLCTEAIEGIAREAPSR
jgi:ribosome-associated toxin RatA of RatAB toxin-antitoxin module